MEREDKENNYNINERVSFVRKTENQLMTLLTKQIPLRI